MSINDILNKIHKDGYWLTKLKEISYPYKPAPENLPKSNSKKYANIEGGDEYDTSPFPNYDKQDGVIGISTAVFINNMSIMIEELMK